MLKVFIVGAGGWGRQILDVMRRKAAHGNEWTIEGFLDSRPHMLDGLNYDISIVGDPLTYIPLDVDAFVCAVGEPKARHKYVQPLLSRGAKFISVGFESYQDSTIHLGNGAVSENHVRIGVDARIGNFANIHSQTVIGHDAYIGNYAQVCAMAFVGGGARIGDFAVINPHATILPGIQIGESAIVGAGAVVLKDVPPGATVFGNPARVIFQKDNH